MPEPSAAAVTGAAASGPIRSMPSGGSIAGGRRASRWPGPETATVSVVPWPTATSRRSRWAETSSAPTAPWKRAATPASGSGRGRTGRTVRLLSSVRTELVRTGPKNMLLRTIRSIRKRARITPRSRLPARSG